MFFHFCPGRSPRKIHLYKIGDPCMDASLLIINSIEIDGKMLLRMDCMDNLGNYLSKQS